VAGVVTGAAEVGAAGLALAAGGAGVAGLALLAAGAAAAGAALALLAGVCAWTTDANEIIPATADNQKALLRRITTLSREIEDRHRAASFPGTKTRASNGAPSSARHLPLREASRQVGFSQFFARLRASGGNTPGVKGHSQISHTLTYCGVEYAPQHEPAGPPLDVSFGLATGRARGPLNRLKNAVSCGKHDPSATVGRPDRTRRSNAAMGRTNRATALTSDGGLIPSNERPAAGRRE